MLAVFRPSSSVKLETDLRWPVLRTRLSALAPLALVGVGLGCAYARTLAPGITWANDGADSGDLIAATATLGVAHPTGYPVYLLLARLFQLIPLGDLALRSTIFSAVAAVLAALCVYLIVFWMEDGGRKARDRRPRSSVLRQIPDQISDSRHLVQTDNSQSSASVGAASSERVRSPSISSLVSAAGAALAIGLAPGFWSQAVIAEVYSLNALFIALMLLFMLQAIHNPAPPWAVRSQALIVGLALGNHATAVIAAIAWFVLSAICAPRGERGLVRRTLWLGVGLLVYLYLPLRASAHPPVNWGDPHDWNGFWWVISGQPYRELAFGLPSYLIYGRVLAWAALLVQQFGWVGLGLGCCGLIYGAPAARRFVWISAGIAAIASAFAVAYATDDSYAYLIPAWLIFAIWLGLGVEQVLRASARLHPGAAAIAATGLAALLVWRALSILPQVDASQDRRAIDYATSVLASAPHNAIVVSDSDLDTFPLWYYHYALHARPDIAVIVDPLLEFDWYRRNLRAVYPDLQIPETTASPQLDAIAAANPRRSVCHTSASDQPPLTCTALSAQR
jgi:hypothetical protein